MKTKPLLIAVGVLAVLAALAGWLSSRSGTQPGPAERMAGDKVLAPAALEGVREIPLLGASDEAKVILRQEDGQWVLPEYFGLPVDFEKLSRFTRGLLDAEIARYVTGSPERLERLELGNNTVRLLGGNEEEWTVQIGGNGSSGGNFIRFNEEPSAYLTTTSLYIDARSGNWPMKRPLSFAESEVARVKLTVDGRELSFAREESGAAFAGENLADNETARGGEVSRLVRSLVSARFTEAIAAGDEDAVAALAHATPVTLELFDGTSYTLKIGRRPGSGSQKPKEHVQPSESGRATSSTSIVIDQDGKVVPPELIAEKEAEAALARGTGQAEETETEVIEPGPVFISFESEASDFIWSELNERVALKFSDHLFSQLPESREKLVEVAPAEEAAPPAEEPRVE